MFLLIFFVMDSALILVCFSLRRPQYLPPSTFDRIIMPLFHAWILLAGVCLSCLTGTALGFVFLPRRNARVGATPLGRPTVSAVHNNDDALMISTTALCEARRQDAATAKTTLLVSSVRNMDPPVSLLDKIVFIPKWMTWQVIRFIAGVQRAMFRSFVSCIAGVVTAIIIDPAVNRAFAHAMKDGLNLFLTQPTIKTKLLEFQDNLSNKEPSLAKPIGEDFPKLLFNFLSGLILQGLDNDDDAHEKQKDTTETKESD